ncbi:hypothetical protein OIU79_030059 [Salix purpurea]|uniref:Uncharacterized protein n=1 Tax=Salix purpurea TaxID=77065 RepID=A0A9Q0ZW37_SALPP|nr:hypothetical protein OIU79_030059 [Salix purpurea]
MKSCRKMASFRRDSLQHCLIMADDGELEVFFTASPAGFVPYCSRLFSGVKEVCVFNSVFEDKSNPSIRLQE